MHIAGLELNNPLIVCSGVLGISSSLFLRLEKEGAGGVVSKSISLSPNEGYDNPTVTTVPCGMLNAMGLPNPGIDAFIEEIEGRSLGIPLIASIYGKDADEFAELAERLGTLCEAIELNLSCPHAGGLLSIGQDPMLVREVVKKAKNAASVPIIAKLTPNVNNIQEIGIEAQKGGADAISAINTVKGMAINIHQEYPILSNLTGGISGPAIKPIGVRAVWDLKKALDIPIIGIGGISRWEDVIEYAYAGASAVQLGTVLGTESIGALSRIKEGIDTFCRQKGVPFEDLVGSVRKRFD